MEYKYEAALSYATEDQELVEKVYHYLSALGICLFERIGVSDEEKLAFFAKNRMKK